MVREETRVSWKGMVEKDVEAEEVEIDKETGRESMEVGVGDKDTVWEGVETEGVKETKK